VYTLPNKGGRWLPLALQYAKLSNKGKKKE